MKVLVVNAGSSSLKFKMYEMPEEKEIVSGTFERIGLDNSFYTIKLNGEKIKKDAELKTHSDAVKALCEDLISLNVIKSLDEIKACGHRIVHGGEFYNKSVLIDDTVLQNIIDLAPLAPLHNKAHAMGIKAIRERIPSIKDVVVFDTAFHQTMEKDKYLYPLPYEYYEKYKVRKYGFHGTSHKYISEYMNEKLDKKANLIICHIGNGASISAVKEGVLVDTSMGFTPNAGLMMGSRCGDIDYSVIPYIMDRENISIHEFDNIANKKSGMLGVSGISSDSRDIEEAAENGNERAILTQKMYNERVASYIASYYVLLEGKVDALVFTAGVGENSKEFRADVLKRISCLGFEVDEDRNDVRGKDALITSDNSKYQAYIIPTDEELMIAKDTYELVK